MMSRFVNCRSGSVCTVLSCEWIPPPLDGYASESAPWAAERSFVNDIIVANNDLLKPCSFYWEITGMEWVRVEKGGEWVGRSDIF